MHIDEKPGIRYTRKALDEYQFSAETPFTDISFIDLKAYLDSELFLTGRLNLILKSQNSIMSFESTLEIKPSKKTSALEAFCDLLEILFNYISEEISGLKLLGFPDFIVPDFPYSKKFFKLDNNDHFYITKRSLPHENKK